MAEHRTFKLTSPHMTGSDIKAWQRTLNRQMNTWKVDYAIPEDGDYGHVTRSLTASVCHGLGLVASHEMAHGVTPELRIKLRNKRLSPDELARYNQRADWRAAFRRRHAERNVCTPINVILQDSWGWVPGVHDGIDLICKPNAPLLAICTGEIVRADAGGWWGLGAPSDPKLRAKGDGVIVLRSDTRAGPFVPGLNFVYGHAEHATVKAGDRVEAGDVIGKAGFANAWHVHLCVNGRRDAKGVGDRDPELYLEFARSAR